MSSFVEIKNLSVDFQLDERVLHAVRNISFQIPKGKTVGLVGESGSGKSVTAFSLMRLVPEPPGSISGGQILFHGKNLLSLSDAEMRNIRGNRMSMIFQEPMSSLNPVFTIGNQIAETLIVHQKLSKKEATERSIKLLHQVEIDNPHERIKAYPHQLSGGQRQRVMIAMAIACNPELLIADEPTTALDVTIQKQIMELLRNLQKQYGMSILFITHDLSLIAEIADEILVMYQGKLVEKNSTSNIFKSPQHPYTKGLMACRPTLDNNWNRLPVMSDYLDSTGQTLIPEDKWGIKKTKNLFSVDVVLEVKNLKKYFPFKKDFFGNVKSWIKAVDDVSFQLRKGETLGLVGESGCGKTTLGRVILRLLSATSGEVIYRGKSLMDLSWKQMLPFRRKMQIIFQDPYSSLNPRMTIESTLTEPMIVHHLGAGRKERRERAEYLMEKVGLSVDMLLRYPHEFSGGQRQRICIARALVVEPEFIVCDESLSALDVSIQSQILNLLLDLQDEMDLSYIFISHDLAVVKFISDEICVMNDGKIVERNNAEGIYKNPQNEYTKKLLNSIPSGIPS